MKKYSRNGLQTLSSQRHPSFCPHGWASGCLVWVFSRQKDKAHHIVIGLLHVELWTSCFHIQVKWFNSILTNEIMGIIMAQFLSTACIDIIHCFVALNKDHDILFGYIISHFILVPNFNVTLIISSDLDTCWKLSWPRADRTLPTVAVFFSHPSFSNLVLTWF